VSFVRVITVCLLSTGAGPALFSRASVPQQRSVGVCSLAVTVPGHARFILSTSLCQWEAGLVGGYRASQPPGGGSMHGS